LHISNGDSGGPIHPSAVLVMEDDDHFYMSFSSPSDRETGILSGNGSNNIH
jgi:hypothetical protein